MCPLWEWENCPALQRLPIIADDKNILHSSVTPWADQWRRNCTRLHTTYLFQLQPPSPSASLVELQWLQRILAIESHARIPCSRYFRCQSSGGVRVDPISIVF